MLDSVILLYTTMVKKTYTASDIEILKGIEPVQKRPGMYTDTSTPNHLLQEVLDNCVDESIAGFCNNIDITLNTDGSYTVKDDGRGMSFLPLLCIIRLHYPTYNINELCFL